MQDSLPIVSPKERLWVRASVAVLVIVGLPTAVFVFPPDSVATQIYVLAMTALTCAIVGLILGLRHRALANSARERSTERGDSVLALFERAAILTPSPNGTVRRVGKGWLALSGAGIAVWELGGRSPEMVLPSLDGSVEAVQDSLFSRPVARLRFADGTRVDAVVTRHGFADLRGWTASDIRALNSKLRL